MDRYTIGALVKVVRDKYYEEHGGDDMVGWRGRVSHDYETNPLGDCCNGYGVVFEHPIKDELIFDDDELLPVCTNVIEGKVNYGAFANHHGFFVGDTWIDGAMELYDGKTVRVTVEVLDDEQD